MGLRLGRGDVTKRGAIIGHSREQLYRKNEFSSANESKLVQSDKLGKRTVKSSRGLNRTATDGFQKSQSSVFLRLSFFSPRRSRTAGTATAGMLLHVVLHNCTVLLD